MSRKTRLFHAKAYPKLLDENAIEIRANTDNHNDQSYYHDPALKLTKDDCKLFVGKPICVEHHPEIEIGRVISAYPDSEDNMRIDAEIDVETQRGQMFFNLVNNRCLPDVSVGYSVNPITLKKTAREVTVCQEGFFDGAEIMLCASKISSEGANHGQSPNSTRGWYISRVRFV